MIAKERVAMIGYWLCKVDKRYFLCNRYMELVCEEDIYVWEHNVVTNEKDIEVGEFEIKYEQENLYLITRQSFNEELAAILEKYGATFEIECIANENMFKVIFGILTDIGYLDKYILSGSGNGYKEITSQNILE